MSGAPSDTTIGPRETRAGEPPRAGLRVVFCGARPRNEMHTLRPGATSIGRDVDPVTGIRLEDDPRLSREHARVIVERARPRLVNCSKNGTRLNGARIDDAPLADGDVIELGDTFAVFRLVPADLRDVDNRAIVGVSPHAARLRSTVALMARTPASVLILGPTGAGKEVTARALHDESGRRGPFLAVNTTAISESLAESQLFGHAAGSFTGASKAHAGWFRDADGGTLFLDEIGDLPLSLQPKLLRALDERQVTPVGAAKATAVDVRVIAATNADLASRVADGRFRADLYARLAGVTITLAPLRERKEDVLPLFEHVLPKGHPPWDPALVSALLAHAWPFNVRELMNVANELAVRAGTGRSEKLTLDLVGARLAATPRPAAPGATDAEGGDDAKEPRDTRDAPAPSREELVALWERHGGVVSSIARETGRSRKQVYRWLQKHGLGDLLERDDEGG